MLIFPSFSLWGLPLTCYAAQSCKRGEMENVKLSFLHSSMSVFLISVLYPDAVSSYSIA